MLRRFLGTLVLLLLTACAPEKSDPTPIAPAPNEGAQAPSKFPLMMSGESAGPMTLSEASEYCRTLNTICDVDLSGESCSTNETGWSLPSADQLSLFIGTRNSMKNLWTRTAHAPVPGTYIYMNVQEGGWGYDYHYSPFIHVRCVK